jgi:HSP20 family protein
MNTNNKMILWRDSLNPFIDFRRDFDHLINDWLTPNPERQPAGHQFVPACDVEEHEDHYLLTLEMAGVKKDDIKMEVVNNQLFISGERRNETRKNEDRHLYSERRYGKFQRTFALPLGLDSSTVEANYQDGILRILVPKSESTKPRQIKITNGSGGSKFFEKFLKHQKEKDEPISSQSERVAS